MRASPRQFIAERLNESELRDENHCTLEVGWRIVDGRWPIPHRSGRSAPDGTRKMVNYARRG